MRTLCLSLGVVVALAAPAAADEIAVGTVVKVDAREIYINLGGGKGVTDGAELRLKRPVTLRHPVTRAPVKDWLPIGAATVTSAGDSLAMAVLDDDLRTAVAVGDIAEVYVERADAPPPPPPTPPPDSGGPMPKVDADTAEVLRVWRIQAGQNLDRRIAAWEGWLSAHATSPHAEAIRADLETLRAQRDAAVPRRPTQQGEGTIRLAHVPPTRADAGRELPLVFVVDNPAAVASASLHYRAVGDATYERVLLRREHDYYLRAAIPADQIIAPGVEYFVEAAVPSGNAGAAYSSPQMPTRVEVAPPPKVLESFRGRRNRTRLSLMATYLDFANLDDREGDRTDSYYFGEIDVLYRIDKAIYGVRAGFGSYGGKGGYEQEPWSDERPAPVHGFQYGYAEMELRLPVKKGPPLGFAGRFYAGVGNDGLGLGVAGRARIGDPDAANLSVAITQVAQLGYYSDLRLETWPDPRMPVGISVGVTDQPNQGELGARLAVDVGWRALQHVQPTLRLSWQGRTAVHSGVGGGLGMVFDW